MPHVHEIDLPSRAAIVTLRCEGRGWTYISQKLANCSPYGAQRFFQRCLARSPCDPDHLDLPILLRFLEDETRRGGRERFPEGSQVEERLVATALQDQEHQDMPFCRVITIVELELGIRIPYSTGYEVLKKAEVVKSTPPQKLYLDATHQQYRLLFSEWALSKLQLGCIFIFTDEMAIESDRHRKRPKVSRRKGSNPFDSSRPPPETFGTVMVWGAICEGRRGPFHIWEAETIEETTKLKTIIDKENQRKQGVAETERWLATIPGTEQYGVLQELNANIQRLDRDQPLPSGHPRQRRRPEWEFKYEVEKRDKKGKGGVDWVRYRETILYPLLYPWAEQIHQETGRFVYIVEDNAGAHTKAKRLAAEARIAKGFDVVDWPPLSPDLNKIERIWDHLKDDVEKLRITTHQNTLAREDIKARVRQAWDELPQLTIDYECRDFKKKLLLCRKNGGRNNFNG